jgi:short-subunit dehydrogenase
VHAYVIAADLSKADAPRSIVEGVSRLGLEVDVLVNNAGYGLYGPFAETSLATELDMIQVNIAALTELTKRLLPGMVARRSGRILNLASTAAFVPGPLMAVYYATKAYVLSFSEAIANELEGSGVTVTALCPGPTASGFQAAASLGESRLVSGKTLPSSRDVAQAGYDALMSGTVVYVPGVMNKLTAMSPRFTPRALIRRIVRHMQERRS